MWVTPSDGRACMDRIDIKVRVGLRIKQLRAQKGISQDKLAYSIDLSRSYLAEVETGKRNVSIINIERICNGLGVSVAEFFESDLFL